MYTPVPRLASHVFSALGLAAAVLAAPPAAYAQLDTATVARATLRAWEEQVRMAIFDRGGAYDGRTSDRGILQRFNEAMDAEYDLDIISSTFSLTQTDSWHRRDVGARFWAGSINHYRLVQHGDFKARVGLGRGWSANARFLHDQSLRTKRNLLWLGFEKRFGEGSWRVFLQGTLQAAKPESDLELGLTWKAGTGELTLALAALDVFNNLVYQSLEVDPGVADTVLDYVQQPFTARFALDYPLGRRFRAEAYGLMMTSARVLVSSQSLPDEGFAQDERYAYAGGLLEWSPSLRSAAGAFATWVRAELNRQPDTAADPLDPFDLQESTWSLGLYAVQRFARRLSYEGWLARVWRSEKRERPEEPVEYEDRTWAGKHTLTYRWAAGFSAGLGLDFTARRTDGPEPVPTLEPLDGDNFRLRFDFGWESAGRAMFVAGANLDLDAGRFDGAHGRFALYW
jgi:hypothetical protein